MNELMTSNYVRADVLLPGMEPGPTADPALSYPSPTDLRFSDLGSRDVKLHWINPAKPVQQYRVVYHSAEGQSPHEVRYSLTSPAPTVLATMQSIIFGLFYSSFLH